MNLKVIFIVVCVSVLIGLAIFYLMENKTLNISKEVVQKNSNGTKTSPTATTQATPKIPVLLDQKTDLKKEINKSEPTDYSQDFKNIKDQLNN